MKQENFSFSFFYVSVNSKVFSLTHWMVLYLLLSQISAIFLSHSTISNRQLCQLSSTCQCPAGYFASHVQHRNSHGCSNIALSFTNTSDLSSHLNGFSFPKGKSTFKVLSCLWTLFVLRRKLAARFFLVCILQDNILIYEGH